VNESTKLTKLPPLSLYIHIPWCVKKCPYCDFNSHAIKSGNLPEIDYINVLFDDLEQALPLIWGRSFKSIFIGGGTPSVFSGLAIDYLLSGIRSRINLSPFAEITMEINPGTLDTKYISDYRLAGVNRVSFGVQSFNDRHLHTLGRIHNSQEAIAAIRLANEVFDNVNIDIMYGLPNQTVEEVLFDIKQAISLSPKHISCYNLTIEPNTFFYSNVPSNLPDNDMCYLMQNAIIDKLGEAGYDRYEISAFAKDKQRSQHNVNYWLYGDYLGIGAGAHSKISFSDKIIRQVRQKHPFSYMESVPKQQHLVEDTMVMAKNIPFEFVMNGFRLIDGIPINLFTERTGLPLNAILTKLQIAQDKGLLTITNGYLKPTLLGHDFLNDLLMIFLED
jgi:oxygen-independent coproporphyrinogen-3 oxidase